MVVPCDSVRKRPSADSRQLVDAEERPHALAVEAAGDDRDDERRERRRRDLTRRAPGGHQQGGEDCHQHEADAVGRQQRSGRGGDGGDDDHADQRCPAGLLYPCARVRAEEARPAEQRRDEEHRVLEHAREKLRGEKRAGDAAEDPAERHADVELGQAGCGGPAAVERAMAQHRVDEEQGEMKREPKRERHARDGGHQRQRRAPDLEARERRRRDESFVAEGEDEGEQEQRQRHDP